MKIIITTPGNFSKGDKSLLIKKGICVIEAKNPAEVKVIGEASFGDADQLLLSAMDALHESMSGTTQSKFFDSLYKRIKKQEPTEPKNEPVKNPKRKIIPTETVLKEKIAAY